KFGVVSNRVPHGAPSPQFPILAAPGLSSTGEDRTLVCPGRIAWHGVKTPDQISSFSIVGGDVASNAKLSASVTDQNLAFDDPGSTGNRIAVVAIDRQRFPKWMARCCVKRDETSVKRPEDALAVPDDNPAVDHVTAGVHCPLTRNLWIK